MTTPTIGSLPVPVPATAPTGRAATDSGTDADAGTGSGSGEQFAGMVADLVAALLGTAAPAASDLSGEARPSPASDGRGTPEELALAAGVVAPSPLPGAAPTPGAVPASAATPATGSAAAACATSAATTGTADSAATGPAGLDFSGEARLSTASDGRDAPQKLAATATAAEVSEVSEAPEAPAPESRGEAAPFEGRTDARALASDSNPNFSGAGRPSPAGEGRGAPEKSDGVTPAGATPGAAPTSATSAVGPAAAASSATPATPTPPTMAAQLAAPITAVHQGGAEGTHVLSVDITPEELGPVRVELELRDGTVELRLAGQSEAARDALRAALPDLRRALEAAGIGTGSFSLGGDGGSPQPGPGDPQNGHARPAWAGGDGRVPHGTTQNTNAGAPTGTGTPAPAGSLDLQL